DRLYLDVLRMPRIFLKQIGDSLSIISLFLHLRGIGWLAVEADNPHRRSEVFDDVDGLRLKAVSAARRRIDPAIEALRQICNQRGKDNDDNDCQRDVSAVFD